MWKLIGLLALALLGGVAIVLLLAMMSAPGWH